MNWAFNQAALLEYQEAAEGYRDRSLQAAERFISEVETAIQEICAAPERYQPIGEKADVQPAWQGSRNHADFRSLARWPRMFKLHPPWFLQAGEQGPG